MRAHFGHFVHGSAVLGVRDMDNALREINLA